MLHTAHLRHTEQLLEHQQLWRQHHRQRPQGQPAVITINNNNKTITNNYYNNEEDYFDGSYVCRNSM
jgi:hypothetical protein